jgi:large subunit ribosomal protein L15
MPLYRRLPKRGFTDRNSKVITAINVSALNRFEDGTEVTPELLLQSGAVSKIVDGVKILGEGELTKKLTVRVHAVSEGAKNKIESAGGTVEVI